MSTIFAKIIRKEIPSKIEFENANILAFHDIAPQAPVHLLIVPKKEIPDLQSLGPEDYPLMGEIVEVAQKLAKKLGIEKGYRLVTNSGSEAGQVVFHLHFHLLGGRRLSGELG